MTVPNSLSSKTLWPMILMVIVFLIALYIASRARRQEVILTPQEGGGFYGVVRESWFNRQRQ